MRSRTPLSRSKEVQRSQLLAPLFAVLLLGCAAGASRPPEEPPQPVDMAEPQAEEAKPVGMASGVKGSEGKDNSIPDDYALTEGDCDSLGKQYGAAARSDQVAALNPRLSANQRAVADANIAKGVGAIEAQWIESCVRSLAGKVVDRKALKCALTAKTVNDFKVCLGDEGSPHLGGKK